MTRSLFQDERIKTKKPHRFNDEAFLVKTTKFYFSFLSKSTTIGVEIHNEE